MQIIPNVDEFEDQYKDSKVVRIGGTFLHGKIESLIGYDIFRVISELLPTKESKLPEGIYPCKFKDTDCLFYYWNGRRGNGLVVFADDENSKEYAQKCFNSKTEDI